MTVSTFIDNIILAQLLDFPCKVSPGEWVSGLVISSHTGIMP